MDADFRKWHIFGYEIPLPSATDTVHERCQVATVQADHEGVEVWGGPEAEHGEAGGWVGFGEFARGLQDVVFGRWVLDAVIEADTVCDGAEIDVEVLTAVGVCSCHGSTWDLIEWHVCVTNNTCFEEPCYCRPSNDIPFQWITVFVTLTVLFPVGVPLCEEARRLIFVTCIRSPWNWVARALCLIE